MPTDIESAKSIIAEAREGGRTALGEDAGKRLLAAFGIAVPKSVFVTSPEDVEAATRLRPPLVVKIVSPEIMHKSVDLGGVALGLESVAEVRDAISDMCANPAIGAVRREGFLVEEMAPPGEEIVIGALKDPSFGPLLMVGLGGVFVELLEDVSFRICPIDAHIARDMLSTLQSAPILQGRARAGAARRRCDRRRHG